MNKVINEFDFVSVHFHGAQYSIPEICQIIGTPVSNGDSWRLLGTQSGKFYSISETTGMEVIEKLRG